MKVLFIDESGDHNLSKKPHDEYPIFVLGGVIVDFDYAKEALVEKLNVFKQKIFGRTDVILHTADITRNRNGFEFLSDAARRNEFYRDLNSLMSDADYSVVACVIRKDDHEGRYGVNALDPYLLGLHVLVERFYYDIGRGNEGLIIAESRGPCLDRQLELAWSTLTVGGTDYLRASKIKKRILAFNIKEKKDNIAGLQLADLVVTPIGRHVLGKPSKEDWQIVERKLRRNPRGVIEGGGLIVLPK